MDILRAPLSDIGPAHVRRLCADEVPEGHELDFKRDLPVKSGRADWIKKGIGEYARDEIAREVVAFANSYGGAVLIGIEETKTRPSRAKAARPLAQVHELARRLHRSIYDVIDPPLPHLEAAGVVTEDDGTSGVVLLRVPPSRRRPHRCNATKDVFVRKNDESVALTMRQVQDLTIQAVSEAQQLDAGLRQARDAFRGDFTNWLGHAVGAGSPDQSTATDAKPGFAFQLLAAPVVPLDLGRLAGRPELHPQFPSIKVTARGETHTARWPFSPHAGDWKPMLRAVCAETSSDYPPHHRYELRADGRCELRYFQRSSPLDEGFVIDWLLTGFGGMLLWVERLRRAAGTPALEFAMAPQFAIRRAPAVLAPYGASHYKGDSRAYLPVGDTDFPILSVGAIDEFARLLQRFDEDLWNHCGIDAPAPEFNLQSLHAALIGPV